jgi:hypothetical protein
MTYGGGTTSFIGIAHAYNRYHHYICFNDWSIIMFYDGVSLDDWGSFPNNLSAKTVTASELVGLPDEPDKAKTKRGLWCTDNFEYPMSFRCQCFKEFAVCTCRLYSSGTILYSSNTLAGLLLSRSFIL